MKTHSTRQHHGRTRIRCHNLLPKLALVYGISPASRTLQGFALKDCLSKAPQGSLEVSAWISLQEFPFKCASMISFGLLIDFPSRALQSRPRTWNPGGRGSWQRAPPHIGVVLYRITQSAPGGRRTRFTYTLCLRSIALIDATNDPCVTQTGGHNSAREILCAPLSGARSEKIKFC